MQLGNFSVSLAVKDIKRSRAFYEKLGFKAFTDTESQNWLIMKNGETTIIGLFQGMFEKNILTFNPRWDSNGQTIEGAPDIREIQSHLKSKGIELQTEIEEGSTGPASFFLEDPDGNQILFDQHV